jgi:hypothetical protein
VKILNPLHILRGALKIHSSHSEARLTLAYQMQFTIKFYVSELEVLSSLLVNKLIFCLHRLFCCSFLYVLYSVLNNNY